jgi:hypothetical protein
MDQRLGAPTTKQASSALTFWHFFFGSKYKPSLQAVHSCPLLVQVAQVAWAHCTASGGGERDGAQIGTTDKRGRPSSKQVSVAGQLQSAAIVRQVQSLTRRPAWTHPLALLGGIQEVTDLALDARPLGASEAVGGALQACVWEGGKARCSVDWLANEHQKIQRVGQQAVAPGGQAGGAAVAAAAAAAAAAAHLYNAEHSLGHRTARVAAAVAAAAAASSGLVKENRRCQSLRQRN